MYALLKDYIIALIPRRVEHFLLISILVYSSGTFFYSNITTSVGQVFRLSGFLLFIYTILKNGKEQPFSGLPLLLYILLLISITYTTFYTFFIADTSLIGSSFYEMGMNLYSSELFAPSIMPLILIVFQKGYHIDINYIVGLMTAIAILYLLISPFALANMLLFKFDANANLDFNDEGGYGEFINESTLHIAAFETPVIMYYWKRYFSNKRWLIFVSVSVIALFMTLYMARRGQSAIYAAYFGLGYLLYLAYDKKTSKLIAMLTGLGIIVAGGLFVFIGSDSFLSLLLERGMEDTRSIVEQNFYNSLDFKDYILGRGWFGQYYDSLFATYRRGVETGYLTLILRGGIFYLVLYVSLLLYSGIRGLFFSKSIFVKSFAIMIIMSVLSLYPFGWPAFDFYFLLIWMGVFICNNDYYLKMTDNQAKLLFYKKTDFLMLLLLCYLPDSGKQCQTNKQLLK